MHFTFNSQQFLNVMSEFVSENIRLGELAGRSESAPQFVEKA
jgi:hypothetical protein